MLLPALPAAWPSGHIKGIKARGGFIVELAWEEGRLTSARLQSTHGAMCSVRYKEAIAVAASDGTDLDATQPFPTIAGEWYDITVLPQRAE
ncbi:hypothetical protein D3C80_1271070 [compost metagenome]